MALSMSRMPAFTSSALTDALPYAILVMARAAACLAGSYVDLSSLRRRISAPASVMSFRLSCLYSLVCQSVHAIRVVALLYISG